jgi:hypothetical protein
MSDAIKIVKMSGDKTPPKEGGQKTSVKGSVKAGPKHTKPKFGILKGGKTARNKPRFEGVADPAKAPPSRKVGKTLRILTEKGLSSRRARIASSASKMNIAAIRQTLRRNKLPIKDTTPDKIVRKIYSDAQEAGMIS